MFKNLDFLRLEYFLKSIVYEKRNDFNINFFNNYLTDENRHFMQHLHSVIEILYIVEGRHLIICDNKEYFAEPGDMMLVRSFTSHELYSDDVYCHHMVLQIPPAVILSMADSNCSSSYLLALSYSNNNSKCLWKRQECEKLGIDVIFQKFILERKSYNTCYDLIRNAYSLEVLTKIIRDMDDTPVMFKEKEDLKRRIYDTTLYIHRNYSNDISAEECAKNVSLSLYYFSRSFKAITGFAFKEYLNIVRIIHANELLASSDLSITEIAMRCGFNSTSHFIVTYKKQQTTTPLAFRKIKRNSQK